MNKYKPFTTYLQTKKEETLTIAISDIEEIIGDKIAKCYYNEKIWWTAKRDTMPRLQLAINEGGYVVSDVDLNRKVVYLKRVNG